MPPGTDSSTEQESETSTGRAPLVSIRGALVHSLVAWTQGKFEDQVLLNPSFELSEESPIEYSIYCIHGTGDRSYAFGKLMERLLGTRDGSINLLPKCISKIHLLAFNSRFQGASIDSFAEQLKYKILKNGDLHVILEGHSRGGLVAAKFAQYMAKEVGVTVHGVLAFCAPFHGSPLAIAPLAAISSSVAQMRSDSEFLKQLRESIISSEEASKKYFYFGVENDSIVPTEDSFIKEHAHSIILFPDHGHLSILTSRVLVGYVSECLHRITTRPFTEQLTIQPIRRACLELEAEIFALTNRFHLYSNVTKLKILSDLKDHLSGMCDGSRDDSFPEARTIGAFIRKYLETIDASTDLSLRDLITQPLNPNFFFFSTAPAKSSEFLVHLIQFYDTVPLPEVDESRSSLDWALV